LVGIKIARGHDASGIDDISVYIGQTIPEAGTVKGLIVMALKQRSEEQNVIGNVAALRNNFHTIHFTKRFGEFSNASSIA